ncbi:DsrE family protein [Sungkyunkwania multivorans]|uniref:DsrE family protein n=1 Tax=Sungkyunkwania multivorans TaxID=1173618 RepID=A0ABW3CVS4_9FLAO
MKQRICILIFVLLTFQGIAQDTPIAGPIINSYGKVFNVDTPDFKTDVTSMMKVVFDVGRTFENNESTNPLIETAARFLNLHAQNGVKAEHMNVALVIHGSASQDILTDAAYQKKFGVDNPNTALIKSLSNAGVQVILCGQTAAYRNISKSDVLPEVQFALSAMTALIQLQNNNYRLINF